MSLLWLLLGPGPLRYLLFEVLYGAKPSRVRCPSAVLLGLEGPGCSLAVPRLPLSTNWPRRLRRHLGLKRFFPASLGSWLLQAFVSHWGVLAEGQETMKCLMFCDVSTESVFSSALCRATCGYSTGVLRPGA